MYRWRGKTTRAWGRSTVVGWKGRTVGWPVASYPDRGVMAGTSRANPHAPCANGSTSKEGGGTARTRDGTASAGRLQNPRRPWSIYPDHNRGASGRIATRYRRGRRNRSRFPLPFGGGDRSGCRLVSALTVPLREHRRLSHHLQRWSRAPPRFPGYGDPRNLQPSRRTAGSVHACAHPVGRWCGNGTGWRCSA